MSDTEYDDQERLRAAEYAEWCEWWDGLSEADRQRERAAIDRHTAERMERERRGIIS